jgi:hypothetical protein
MPGTLSILDGSNANIDLSLDGNSYKCVFNFWTADIVRAFTEATTFCSSGWRSRVPGLKQLVGHAQGYASKGQAISDPSALIAEQSGIPIVLTADTGCTFSFTGHVSRSRTSFRAAENSDAGLDFESTGPVTVAWVLA